MIINAKNHNYLKKLFPVQCNYENKIVGDINLNCFCKRPRAIWNTSNPVACLPILLLITDS